MPPGPPPFEDISSSGPPPMEGAGFAQSMGAFGNMLKIQESISELLPESKVPWNESRKFLKANTIENIKSTPLYKFHRDLFKKIGLGDIQLIGYAPMHYIFGVPDCPVCNLYPALNNQKVCAATTDALYRFFAEDLELECSVEEIECTKDGGQICKFKVDLQPISAYQIMLDETDRKILNGQDLKILVLMSWTEEKKYSQSINFLKTGSYPKLAGPICSLLAICQYRKRFSIRRGRLERSWHPLQRKRNLWCCFWIYERENAGIR